MLTKNEAEFVGRIQKAIEDDYVFVFPKVKKLVAIVNKLLRENKNLRKAVIAVDTDPVERKVKL